MHQETSEGIIVRSWLPTKRTLICLDQSRGKSMCILTDKTTPLLCQGLRVQYTLKKGRDAFFLSDIDTIAEPAEWVHNDIFFFHHVLELCTVYTPFNHEAPELYSQLLCLYTNEKSPLPLFKKFFLCKLVSLLDCYPDDPVYMTLPFSLQASYDSIVHTMSKTENEQKINRWLLRALHVAGAQELLKTFSFVKQLDIT